MRAILRWLMPVLVSCVFGGSAQAAAPAPDHPDWSDARTRAAAQLEVVAALLDAGLPDKALVATAEVRASGNAEPQLDVLQARALHATGMHTEARTLLDTHLKRRPGDAQGWAALGVVLADGGDAAGSVRALERADRISPKDASILNNLGFARLAAGSAEGAVTAFRLSLGQDPSQPRTRNNLGLALARLERDDEALEAFRAAGPEPEARYNLGLACELRGDRGSALAHYHAALAAAPDHASSSQALTRLLSENLP